MSVIDPGRRVVPAPVFDCWGKRVGEVEAKDLVKISFPITERTVEVDIEKHHYTLVLRGNEVVKIEPPGRYCPLYQRDHYRQDDVRWRKVTRFVSEEQIFW